MYARNVAHEGKGHLKYRCVESCEEKRSHWWIQKQVWHRKQEWLMTEKAFKLGRNTKTTETSLSAKTMNISSVYSRVMEAALQHADL